MLERYVRVFGGRDQSEAGFVDGEGFVARFMADVKSDRRALAAFERFHITAGALDAFLAPDMYGPRGRKHETPYLDT